MRLLQRFWLIIKLYYTGEGRYKVHPIFERCTLLVRNFTVVPYKHRDDRARDLRKKLFKNNLFR